MRIGDHSWRTSLLYCEVCGAAVPDFHGEEYQETPAGIQCNECFDSCTCDEIEGGICGACGREHYQTMSG